MKTMRLPSRRMPPPVNRDFPFGLRQCLVILAGLALAVGYLIHAVPPLGFSLIVIATLVCLLFIFSAFSNRQTTRRLQALADARKGESICAFARSFDARETDTWVIRAAYQEVQQWLQAYADAFPVRASDTLVGDLEIDAEDVEDLIRDIAKRSGHSIEKPEDNPYHGSVLTVSDLVLFISAQPRQALASP